MPLSSLPQAFKTGVSINSSLSGAKKFVLSQHKSNVYVLMMTLGLCFLGITLERRSNVGKSLSGEAERGAKRRADNDNAIASGENCTRSYLRTRRSLT